MNKPLVSAIYRVHGTAGTTVPENMLLEGVIGVLAGNPSLRAAFLVDSANRYSSAVTRSELLKWAHLSLSGGKGSRASISEALRILTARKARDLATVSSSVLTVRESDSIEKALFLMADNEQDVLPVLDNERRVLGDLTPSEVLYWLLTHGSEFGDVEH